MHVCPFDSTLLLWQILGLCTHWQRLHQYTYIIGKCLMAGLMWTYLIRAMWKHSGTTILSGGQVARTAVHCNSIIFHAKGAWAALQFLEPGLHVMKKSNQLKNRVHLTSHQLAKYAQTYDDWDNRFLTEVEQNDSVRVAIWLVWGGSTTPVGHGV